MQSTLIADSFVSVSAVIGLLILRHVLRRSDRSQWIKSRFSFAILVLALMFSARVLLGITGFELFRVVNLIAAALIPLAMLVLSEGLMRRHASRLMKVCAVVGALVFTLLSPFEAYLDTQALGLSLLAYQIVFFVVIGYWVVTRNRSDLSAAENRIIDRLALSLLVIIPFAIADFRTVFSGSPVRLSGAAILFLCWLALSLDRARVGHLQTMYSFAMVLLGSCIAAGTISWIAALDFAQSVQTGAVVLCSAMVFQVYAEARSLRVEDESDSLLRYVADFDGQDTEAFLRGLQSQPLVAGALILNERELAEFDESMRSHVSKLKIVTAPSEQDQISPEISDQVSWLLEKYTATHAIFVSSSPFSMVLINMPSLATANGTDLELKVVQRFAELLSKSKAAG